MSLLKVTVGTGTAAIATIDQMHTKPAPLALNFAISASCYAHFDLGVCPAAVISEIPSRLTGSVIHHNLQHILARFAEGRLGYSMAILDLCRCRIESDP